MSLLGQDEILNLIKGGKIIIDPFDEAQVGPGSIDLHLGNLFRVFKPIHTVFLVNDDADYTEITEEICLKDNQDFVIMPGELVHGITKEKITLPTNIAGFIEGRSRFARVGLLTHLSSGFIHPGTSNKTVLEMANISPMPLAVRPGTKICQVVLIEVKGHGSYTGKFAGQVKP